MKIISVAEARESGHKWYFTGKPCKHGHVARRQVSNRTCEACAHQRTKEWFLENPEYYAEYRKENIEAINKKERAYYDGNAERISMVARIYRQANPEKGRARRQNAIARKKNADGTHTHGDILRILASQDFKCVYCAKDIADGYHVDHRMPLALGGSNWPDNLQCLCMRCNTRKSAKHPEAWEKEIGFSK